jgi:RimJ/RimL family protein N-acetyltransferase/uncharacterized protein YciI
MQNDSRTVEDVKLVGYDPKFFEDFLRWRFQKSTTAHNPLAPRSTEELARDLEQVSSDLVDYPSRTSFRWFISCGGIPVGHISLSNVNQSMLIAEIGYTLGESHHGKGIATTGAGLLIEKVFAETPLRKLTAFVHDRNFSSLRLLHRLGFKQEGLLRQHYLVNGVPVNEAIFGLLREDWANGESANSRLPMPKLIKFVILLQVIADVVATLDLVRRHVQYLRNLDLAGKLLLAGPFEDQGGGMVIIEARDLHEAVEIARCDPFVTEGARAFEVRQWNISSELNKHLGIG